MEGEKTFGFDPGIRICSKGEIAQVGRNDRETRVVPREKGGKEREREKRTRFPLDFFATRRTNRAASSFFLFFSPVAFGRLEESSFIARSLGHYRDYDYLNLFLLPVESRAAFERQALLFDYLNIERTRTDGNRFVGPNGDYTANQPLPRPSSLFLFVYPLLLLPSLPPPLSLSL